MAYESIFSYTFYVHLSTELLVIFNMIPHNHNLPLRNPQRHILNSFA